MFAVTSDAFYTLFHKVNAECFGDSLPNDFELDIFTEDEMPNEMGYCIDDGVLVLGLVEEFDSIEEFEAVLKHELIHMEQWINDRPVNHGKEFRRRAREIGASE